MKLNLRMIALIVFSISVLVSALLVKWVLPPEKAVRKIQERLGTSVISAVQKRLNLTEGQGIPSDGGGGSKGLPKVEGISKALLGRDNPFEPLSEVPKGWTPTTTSSEPPTSTSARSTRTSDGNRSGFFHAMPEERRNKKISPPKIELKGILLGTPKMAILDLNGSTVILTEGRSVGDIQVMKIEEDKVTLNYKGERINLKMREIPIQQVRGR